MLAAVAAQKEARAMLRQLDASTLVSGQIAPRTMAGAPGSRA